MGGGFTVDGDEVMGGVNDAKFGGKRRFGNLVVGNEQGEEVEGGGGIWSCCRRQFLPEGCFMMSIPVPTFCASV